MLLWFGFAVLTACVLAAVLRPLWAKPHGRADADPAAVYRDQLDEVAGDLERGLIDAGEAEAARTEIARRLLAATEGRADVASTGADSVQAGAAAGTKPLPARLATVLAAAVPAVAIAVYLAVGSPGVPDQPLAARLKAPLDTGDVARLIAAVEQRLAQHPEDGQGWDVIAPVYLRNGAFDKAADAYARATRILGETPRRLAGFAEASVLASDGTVTEAALQAWRKLAALEPDRPEPRFWIAVAKEQAGDLAGALVDLRALIDAAPQDAAWRPLVAERIAEITSRTAERPVAAPEKATRGPTEADVAAADKLSAADRQRMIEGMVEGLAARLARDGRDLPGWQRLIRAYAVLGRKDAALDALKAARGHFKDEAGSLATLTDLARALGLET